MHKALCVGLCSTAPFLSASAIVTVVCGGVVFSRISAPALQ